jgi:hypothetical protein
MAPFTRILRELDFGSQPLLIDFSRRAEGQLAVIAQVFGKLAFLQSLFMEKTGELGK